MLVRAHRVTRRHRADFHFRVGSGSLTHRCNGLRLIVLNPDQGFFRPDGMHHDARPIDHLLGEITHDPIVTGKIWLALAAIDNQGRHLESLAELKLDRRREGCASQAHHPGLGRHAGDFFRRRGKGISQAARLDPAVFPIGFNGDGTERQPGGMRRGHFTNRHNRPRHRGMNRGGDIPLGFGNQLPLEHLLSHQHHRPGRPANVLAERHINASRRWQETQRCIRRRALVIIGMHPPTGVLEEPVKKSHDGLLSYAHWLAWARPSVAG